ncbi:MAG: AMP-binding protein [Gammaproteobacteria bacterium]|nr:AMP-binding protein [Gammaproteobacteria bacterium]
MQLEHWVSHAASRSPDKVAIHFQGSRISYAQFDQLIDRLTWLLRYRFHVSAGERVAHLALNNPVFLALIFACARIGAIVVPINFRLARPELAFLFDDARPTLLFGDSDLLTDCTGGGILPSGCRLISLDESPVTARCDSLSTLLEESRREQSRSEGSDPTAPLLVVYTSGTTGKPKGAVLDQNALRWNALNSQHMHSLSESDHILTVLPFFHVGGINIQTLPGFHFGATVTLLPTFSAEQVLETITTGRPTLTVLVPTQMRALAELAQWREADLTSLRAVTTGSTMVDRGLLESWQAHDVKTLQVYGCTESSPIAIHQCMDDTESALGSVGKAARYCNVRIVDETGVPVPPGSRGEIQLRGPNILRYYWNNPDATAAALHDGWLSTGDIGYQGEAGEYYVVDRIKNMVISGGENIYPAEIERTLLQHPDIEEAAVVGLPDPKWGEIVAAVIVTRSESQLDTDNVREYLDGKVGNYKLPRRIAFLSELPRNAMGKTDYKAVRSSIISRA